MITKTKSYRETQLELQIICAILVSLHPTDEDKLSQMINSIDGQYSGKEYLIQFIDQLLRFSEQKEMYKTCSELLRLKEEISNG